MGVRHTHMVSSAGNERARRGRVVRAAGGRGAGVGCCVRTTGGGCRNSPWECGQPRTADKAGAVTVGVLNWWRESRRAAWGEATVAASLPWTAGCGLDMTGWRIGRPEAATAAIRETAMATNEKLHCVRKEVVRRLPGRSARDTVGASRRRGSGVRWGAVAKATYTGVTVGRQGMSLAKGRQRRSSRCRVRDLRVGPKANLRTWPGCVPGH
jgi:hypothetical protein